MEWLNDLLAAYPWGIYALVAIGPFIQEDAAIISAAAASAAGAGSPRLLFVTLLIGLSLSDLWKYWLGRVAHTHEWGRKFAQKPGVKTAREQVVNRLGLSLITARFVPGTRVPLYIACGFFKAPFWKVALYIIFSATVYVAIAFTLFHLLGDMAGDRIHMFAPIFAMFVVALVATYLLVNGWLKRRTKNGHADADT